MITLASGSPRRRLLLEQLGYALSIRPTHIDETPTPNEPPLDYALRMARDKARACPASGLVIAADTVVHDDRAIFHKPADPADAERILAALSGRAHTVTTGTCVRLGDDVRARTTSTRVWFRDLSADEIRGYVATGEPLDKAGAYGIQGIGGFLVARIDGSYSNVVGLPLAEILSDVAALGGPGPFSEHP